MPEDAAAAGHSQEAILVKKIKKVEGGHHGGAWKVAYADMVTALMALFIVLWILSQSEEVVRNVAGYFRDPIGFREGGDPVAVDTGASASTPAPPLQPPAMADETSRQAETARWREQARAIQTALEDLPSFAKYQDQVEIALTPEGLRITLIESNETPLFEIGGVALHHDAEELLTTIGEEIAGLRHPLVIEGHTDSRPFQGSSEMTNWELSTGRAHTARRVLERAGIEPGRVFEVRGLADRQLYNPTDPDDSRNRRVAITLLSDEAYAQRRKQSAETLPPQALMP